MSEMQIAKPETIAVNLNCNVNYLDELTTENLRQFTKALTALHRCGMTGRTIHLLLTSLDVCDYDLLEGIHEIEIVVRDRCVDWKHELIMKVLMRFRPMCLSIVVGYEKQIHGRKGYEGLIE